MGFAISDERLRAMYRGGRGNAAARRFARVWSRVFGLGVAGRRWVSLEVPGRVSGRVTRFPVGLADLEGRWYLVSMLGDCNWVKNLRANEGRVTLRRGRAREYRTSEIPAVARAPVLARYVAQVPGSRPHIPVAPGAPLTDFEAIAERYPVFEVVGYA